MARKFNINSRTSSSHPAGLGFNVLSTPHTPSVASAPKLSAFRVDHFPLAYRTVLPIYNISYARTSIHAAKTNAQRHREADGGQISWRNESLRRHGVLERPEEEGLLPSARGRRRGIGGGNRDGTGGVGLSGSEGAGDGKTREDDDDDNDDALRRARGRRVDGN
ncbi:MAG: hypothetical protein M1837_000831 [Sclerophora amabilis]|nr:MAG: hypothetical protein M1837_000831 [Sclerophora amabilis]